MADDSQVAATLDRTDTPASYDPAYFARLFAIEDRHFWFRARNRSIAAIAKQLVAPLAPGYRVLEIGCGTGVVLRVLQDVCRGGSVIGIDPFPEALAFARQRTTCELLLGDALNPPIAGPVELIGMFDVLEHLEDDIAVLRALRGRLVAGGALLLTVPAEPTLWSYFDEASYHQRRYSRATLVHVVREAGYTVEYVSHFMAALYPLMWSARRVSRLLPILSATTLGRSGDLAMRELRIVPGVNAALATVLGLEAQMLARRFTLPIGTSLLAVARAPRAE